MRTPNSQTRTTLLVTLVIVGSVSWLFGEVLFSDQSFAYRDTASFYDPLFQWTTGEWKEGRIPLWNPHENTGTPVLADASSSLFYPGKVLYFLPLSAARCNAIYVIVHMLLAAANVYQLARKWHASAPASGIAALSYALSGPILFQYCNVVYLVSAAWMPLAWLAISAQYKRMQMKWTVILAIALALMILGGDPQAAYHTILAALILFGLQWRKQTLQVKKTARKRLQWLARSGGQLVTAVIGASLLSAVQVLPSMTWADQSERAHVQVPQNLYQVANAVRQRAVADETDTPRTSILNQLGQPLLETPQAGTHGRNIYWFSIGPWRLLEWFWPNFSGQRFPKHQRWIEVLPAESPPWTPTLYMGLLPLLIALSSLTFRSGHVRWRWISWLAVLAILASFGWFGFGWVLCEIRSLVVPREIETPLISPPAGGLYWWMVVLLPGYAQFRFPAKVFTLASLALSLLAARGWDRIFSPAACARRQHRLKNLLLLLSGFSLCAAVLIWSLVVYWSDWVDEIHPDLLFGPLQAQEAVENLVWSFLHTGILASVFWFLLRWYQDRRGVQQSCTRWKFSAPVTCAFSLTALELVFAHQGLVQLAPFETWQEQPAAALQLHSIETVPTQTGRETDRVFRGHRSRWAPQRWKGNSAKTRLHEIIGWDRDTLRPRYHLQTPLSLVESETSIRPFDYISVLRVGRQLGWKRADGVREPHPSILSALGARYWLLPANTLPPGSAKESAEDQAASDSLRRVHFNHVDNWALWENPNSLPRVWIVRRWQSLKPLQNPSWRAVQRRTESVFFPDGHPRNLLQEAVIESDQIPEFPQWTGNIVQPPQDRHVILHDEAQRLDIEVSLKEPALLVIRDYFDTDWKATLRTSGAKTESPLSIVRTNRIMRGIWLPMGTHRISMQYRPLSFIAGGIISLITWITAGVFVLYRVTRFSH